MTQAYDLIGDIHGHAQKLVELLEYMGYRDTSTGYQHPTNKVIFVGDFIDRGEHLKQHRRLLDIIMTMVNNGHALAVMGNHEFNALAFDTEYDGEYLRRHTEKNIKQHRAFLNEFPSGSKENQQALEFFMGLPMWLEVEGFRVIHACWDQSHIDYVDACLGGPYLTKSFLIEASQKGTQAYESLEWILKGPEYTLPPGFSYHDKNGIERTRARIAWWHPEVARVKDMLLESNLDLGELGKQPAPDSTPTYAVTEPNCFVGHYWFSGQPRLASSNVACLDFSVAKGGRLTAYRWQGESQLTADHFCFVPDTRKK